MGAKSEMRRTQQVFNTWWKRLRWAWGIKNIQFTQFSHVGNRVVHMGMVGNTEVTIVYRNTKEEDGYSREELLTMLKEIRVNEERQNWLVPEPIRCGDCGHCSPVDENGFCPVRLPKIGRCPCSTHEGGQREAMRRALEEALGRSKVQTPEEKAQELVKDCSNWHDIQYKIVPRIVTVLVEAKKR